MKEKNVGEVLLTQSNKILDCLDGLKTVEEVCSELTYCKDVDITHFKNRMLKRTGGKEIPVIEIKEPETKTGTYLGSRSIR